MAKTRRKEEEIRDTQSPSVIETKALIRPLNLSQRRFVKAIKGNSLTIALGPAGTGKSLLALFNAVCLINNPNSSIERIVYIRANVGADQEDGIGFLPGGKADKIRPLCYPLIDNMTTFMSPGLVNFLINNETIEVLTLSMLRGRSFNNCFIILDEAQCASSRSMKTVITRMAEGSKLVIIGDPSQKDTPNHIDNGLLDLKYKLTNHPHNDCELVEFSINDIVRHHLLKDLLLMYE